MALSHVKTPLASRIMRWAKSGRAKSILLHPSDYKIVSNAKAREKLEQMYNLKVLCLGGEEALKKHLSEEKKSDDDSGEES